MMLRVLQSGTKRIPKFKMTSNSNKFHQQHAKKAVIFDMGGVIIPTPVPLVQAFAVKNNLNPKQMDDLLFKGGDESLWGQLECGLINTKVFGELLTKRSSELFGRECKDEIISKMIIDQKYYQPYPEMMSAIQTLKNHGIKTALLTNNFLLENGESVLFMKNDFDVVSFLIIKALYNSLFKVLLNVSKFSKISRITWDYICCIDFKLCLE